MSALDDLNTLDDAPRPSPAPSPLRPVVVRPASPAWKVLGAAVLSAAMAFPAGQWYETRRHNPPVPAPAPAPRPLPPPVPPPRPAPVTAQLIATAVYPAEATTDNFAFSAVRDDPELVATLRALDVVWHAFPATDPRVDALHLRPYVEPVSAPMLLVYDAAGNVYGPDGRPYDRVGGKAFKAPLTVDETVALFRRLRGKS